jgi:outer membrane biosynthesis protein TonB
VVRALPFEPADDRETPTDPAAVTPEPLEDDAPSEAPPPSPEVLPETEELPPVEHIPAVAPSSPAPDVVGVQVRVRQPPAGAEDAAPSGFRGPVAAPVAAEAGAPRPPRPPLRAIESPNPPVVPEIPAGVKVSLTLEYTISADGRVVEARVVASSGYPTQDATTRDFVLLHWRYHPPGTVRRVVRRFIFGRA